MYCSQCACIKVAGLGVAHLQDLGKQSGGEKSSMLDDNMVTLILIWY